ncbi:2OG-Fe(II) oxygenase family protein [Dongia deserti]|uniref:2OG-Fe(II) oxygenase family protein n=1 Tax=Dongia deserti TaxID=2268030 RepID=UPI0025493E3D|nr:2OG-Fe(II) oxygenase [Dongia deserti]
MLDADAILTARRARLERGDRFPNFLLPDRTGAVRSLLERARGWGLAVFLDPDQALRATLKELGPGYGAAELDCIVLDNEAADDSDLCVLADSVGKVRAGLREMSGQQAVRPLAFLLDRNQRVIAVESDGDLAQWALRRWTEGIEAAKRSDQVSAVAPVLIVPNVLSPLECHALIERWSRDNREGTVASIIKGEVVQREYEKMKKRRDHTIAEQRVAEPLLALLARRLAPELDKAYHYRRFRMDRPLIVCYDAERGDYFRRHRDNQTPATANRQFALTLNLNSGYEGGELIFPEYGDQRYKPPAGGAILFSCSLLHEALPVTEGRRFALLTFLRDANQSA